MGLRYNCLRKLESLSLHLPKTDLEIRSTSSPLVVERSPVLQNRIKFMMRY